MQLASNMEYQQQQQTFILPITSAQHIVLESTVAVGEFHQRCSLHTTLEHPSAGTHLWRERSRGKQGP